MNFSYTTLEVWPESQFAEFWGSADRRIIVALGVMRYAKRLTKLFMYR